MLGIGSQAARILAVIVTTGVGAVSAQGVPADLVWPTVNGATPDRRINLLVAPSLRLGTSAGPEPTLLSGVVGAVRLPNGTIAIGDAAGARVVFFDARGTYLRSAGRAGDGPGEYRFPRWLGGCADGTIAVYDAGHNAVTFLSAAGELVGSMALPAGLTFESPFWCSGPDQVVLLLNKSRARVRPGQHLAVPTAVVRVRGPSDVDTVQSGGVQEYYVAKSIGAFVDLPLGRATLVAAGRTRLFSASSDRGTVTVFDTAGVRRGTVSLNLPRARVTRADWAQAVRSRIAAAPLERTRKVLGAVLEELQGPAVFPAIDQIRADAADNLWVRTCDNFTTDVATWLVLSSGGTPLAAAVAPRSLNLLEIGRDYVLGVVKDPDGVEQVVLFRLDPL